jgi:hypothetical protein
VSAFTVTFVEDIPVAIEVNGQFRRVELTAEDLARIDAKFRLDPQPITFSWEGTGREDER